MSDQFNEFDIEELINAKLVFDDNDDDCEGAILVVPYISFYNASKNSKNKLDLKNYEINISEVLFQAYCDEGRITVAGVRKNKFFLAHLPFIKEIGLIEDDNFEEHFEGDQSKLEAALDEQVAEDGTWSQLSAEFAELKEKNDPTD